MIGYPIDKATLNNRVGGIVVQLREVLADAVQIDEWLADQQDADIEALGFTTEDVTLVRASFVDLAKLARIAHGQDTQPAASDFFFNADHLVGLQ